jgi:AcrR family transcriptional regulator
MTSAAQTAANTSTQRGIGIPPALRDSVSLSIRAAYADPVPRLWSDTIDEHRRAVREAILDAAGGLVVERGLRGVAMSLIAERAGIGRATLYKYFPDVESVLHAWHERQVAAHLVRLTALSDGSGTARERLKAVLTGYAVIVRESGRHDRERAAELHRGGHGHQDLHVLIRDLVAEATTRVPPDELARFCVHALGAAAELDSADAVRRLVEVTMACLDAGTP